MNDAPVVRAAQPKKGPPLGCLIAAVALLVVLLGLGLALRFWLKSDQAQAILEVIQVVLEANEKAKSAPGTAELRAIGCAEALALDLSEVTERVSRRLPGDGGDLSPNAEWLITCSVAAPPGPACEAVAQTYVRALGGRAAAPFLAMVQSAVNADVVCEMDFDAEGKRVFTEQRPVEVPEP